MARARPTASGPRPCGGPTARGGTRAAGARARASTSPKTSAHRRAVLRDGVAAARACGRSRCPARVGAVVVDASSSRRARRVVDPGPRPVVVALGHEVVQAERRHVVDRRLARARASSSSRAPTKRVVVAERHPRPTRRRSPRDPSIGSQASRPNAYQFARRTSEPHQLRSVPTLATPAMPVSAWPSSDPSTTLRDERALAPRVGVGAQRLLEQRREVDEVRGEAEVLLRDLELQHQRRARHRAEQRVERLARLEVDRAVLHLHAARSRRNAPSSGMNSSYACFARSPGDLVRVDERAPHHDAAVRRDARRPACSRRRRACGRSPAAPAGPRSWP